MERAGPSPRALNRGADITFRSATPRDLPSITQICAAAFAKSEQSKILYPHLDRYYADFRRVEEADMLADFWDDQTVFIVAVVGSDVVLQQHQHEDQSRGGPTSRDCGNGCGSNVFERNERVMGFAAWDFTPGSSPSSLTQRRGNGGSNSKSNNITNRSSTSVTTKSPLEKLLPTDHNSFCARLRYHYHNLRYRFFKRFNRSTNWRGIMLPFLNTELEPVGAWTQMQVDALETEERKGWFLLTLGVHPDGQGLGIGRKLVEWCLDRMDLEDDQIVDRDLVVDPDVGRVETKKALSDAERQQRVTKPLVSLGANPGTQEFYRRCGFQSVTEKSFRGYVWNEMVLLPRLRPEKLAGS